MFAKPKGQIAPLRQEYLARDKLAWLLVLQTLLILPLLFNLPVWLWLVWAVAGFWRTQVFRGRWGAPGGTVKTLLALVCAAGLLASYSGKTGTETMVGLLVCAFVLKLLEVNSARDAQLLVLIGFIISASQLLFSQSPQAAIYCLGCMVVLLTSWRSLYLSSAQPNRQQLKRGALILLHALPVMLVLFIVIPRLGPLWAIPNQQAAKTGFSDSLSPGDLGNLALNRAPAFRVEFSGTPPAANQLYWRGLVLDNFDGRTWTQRDHWGMRQDNNSQNTPRDLLNYSVIVEPHGQPWLFSLMTPQTASTSANPIRITTDSLLLNRTPVAQRLRYSVSSALRIEWHQAPIMSTGERDFYTRLPRTRNPQTLALAEQWRSETPDDQMFIERALALFNREFTYSLQPPLLGQESVDEFLFTTKTGFCEHFASSFSVLLRAAGIPVRVVVGYQGGRWNPVENYLLVSQADAHAWTEVWLEGKGWQTIDPTGAVAPDRIEQGIDDALSDDEQDLVSGAWSSSSLFYDLQLRWDAATFVWQRWVLNYDSEAQQGLLTRLLGGTESWRLTLWLIGAGLIGAALFAWVLVRNHQVPLLRPETRALKKLEHKLAQLGYQRQAGETVGDFVAGIIRSNAKLKPALEPIARVFEQIAYQNQTQQIGQLQERIKRFPRP